MTTDGSTPKPCNPKIFKKGTRVFTTHSIDSSAIGEWVKSVARLSGQPVDWHYFGGVAIVLALGDLNKVRRAINLLMPEHDRLFQLAVGDLIK